MACITTGLVGGANVAFSLRADGELSGSRFAFAPDNVAQLELRLESLLSSRMQTPVEMKLLFESRVRSIAVVACLVVLLSVGSAHAHGMGFAPGSARILYTSSWSGPSQIYSVDPSGRGARGQLTSAHAEECLGIEACGAEDPVPSPNGKQVLYRIGYVSLWTVRGDGTNPRRVWPRAPAGDAELEEVA